MDSGAKHLLIQVLNREIASTRTIIERMEADKRTITEQLATVKELIAIISSVTEVDPKILLLVGDFQVRLTGDA